MYKKVLLLTVIFLTSLPICEAYADGKQVPRSAIKALVSEFRHYDEFESISLGKFTTGLLKKAVALGAWTEDKEDREEARLTLAVMKSVKGITIADYEDCSFEVRHKFNARLCKLLEGVELLMTAKDDGESLYIYGCTDKDGREVRDLVLFSPDDGSLVCVFGTIRMEDIGKLIEAEK